MSADIPTQRPSAASGSPNPTYAFAAAFFDELARSGVVHVCISPGSRSTPLAVAAGQTDRLRVWSHLDERASAFFALGLAKASRTPVALICTSGTALANYAPAVIESHYAGVPLLVLSADRPAELREWGAGQTIDQVKLFGDQVRFFAELPIPEAGPKMLRYARTIACRAVEETRGIRPGPVHLNWPLREPFEPVLSDAQDGSDELDCDVLAESGRRDGRPYVRYQRSTEALSTAQIENFATRLRGVERGVIASGVMDDPRFGSAVSRLGTVLGWPVLAEPTSGLRCGPHIESTPVIAASDLFLRSKDFADSHRPEFVIRFGATPVSKAFRLWIETSPPEEVVLVRSDSAWQEPSHLMSDFVVADAVSFCEALCQCLLESGWKANQSGWLNDFTRADDRTQEILERRLNENEMLLEPRATRLLCEQLPADSILYVSNSMPIRDLDAFMAPTPKAIRFLSNRGANGIDGINSSALGAAAGSSEHVVLLTGDLAFLYDVGGFLAARRYSLNLTIVVLNNDGGGIFSFLPIAEYGEQVRFEELFTTPHGVDLASVARLYELSHTRVETWADYSGALEKAWSEPGVSIIEVPIDREANLEHFRSLVDEVAEAVAPESER